ncbi:hypothetical protein CYLTODRAFT_418253, partial [Cylindrobasidium torrendii FP15055 ss-10]
MAIQNEPVPAPVRMLQKQLQDAAQVVQSCEESVEKYKSELNFLIKQLNTAEHSLALARKERARLLVAVKCNSPTSRHARIHIIPNEILVEVFRMCLEDQITQWPGHRRPTLMAVCSLWLRIILAAPCLWNELIMIPSPSNRPASERFRELERRSGAVPLSITCHYSAHREAAQEFLRHLRTLHHRVYRLRLLIESEFVENDTLDALQSLTTVDRTLVKHFSVGWGSPEDTAEKLQSWMDAMLDRMPNLCSLHVLSAWMPKGTLPVTLTDLSLYQASIETLFEVLRNAPQLINLAVACIAEKAAHSQDVPVHHKNLESLRLATLNNDNEAILFSSLTLPALRELDLVVFLSKTTLWPTDAALSFLARSHCSLRRLRTTNARLSPRITDMLEPGLSSSNASSALESLVLNWTDPHELKFVTDLAPDCLLRLLSEPKRFANLRVFKLTIHRAQVALAKKMLVAWADELRSSMAHVAESSDVREARLGRVALLVKLKQDRSRKTVEDALCHVMQKLASMNCEVSLDFCQNSTSG